ncbi:MAG: hypothetical protein ACI86M_003817 [Saprospiraceae bacterium]|jgi:hypothetical protein
MVGNTIGLDYYTDYLSFDIKKIPTRTFGVAMEKAYLF